MSAVPCSPQHHGSSSQDMLASTCPATDEWAEKVVCVWGAGAMLYAHACYLKWKGRLSFVNGCGYGRHLSLEKQAKQGKRNSTWFPFYVEFKKLRETEWGVRNEAVLAKDPKLAAIQWITIISLSYRMTTVLVTVLGAWQLLRKQILGCLFTKVRW